MSAICGVFRAGDRPVPEDALDRMMQASALHGPDGSHIWRDDRVAMGQQTMFLGAEARTERLPVHLPERGMTLAFDGRLHNRDELVAALGLPRHESLCDSDLLIAAWDAWGSRCAERLVGEFAFALWNARDRALHLVTDPMGVRPLFYRELPGGLAFASHVETLLAATLRRPPLNHRRLAMLGVSALTVYLEPEMTCFEGIWRMPPASLMTLTAGRKLVREYWRPDQAARIAVSSDAECREAFLEVFRAAVESRVPQARPTTALLSGGLDSSSIVEMARRRHGPVDALSLVAADEYRGRVEDEREYVELFREREDLQIHWLQASNRGPFDALEELVRSDSLVSYSYQHFLYTEIVTAAASLGSRIIFDGHGGELSASITPRGWLAELARTGRWRELARELRQHDQEGQVSWRAIRSHVLKPLVPYRIQEMTGRHRRFGELYAYPLRAEYVRDVLGEEVADIVNRVHRLASDRADHRANLAADIAHEREDLRQRLHAGFVDHHRALFTYPFLDKRMLEFGLGIDGRFKYRDGCGRRLLRAGMDGLLAERIRTRTGKRPICPDYDLRYAKQFGVARREFERLRDNARLKSLVDFELIDRSMRRREPKAGGEPMHLDPASQFMVPCSLYLCYFLQKQPR